MTIMRGDQYAIPFILHDEEAVITADDVSKVEIMIGTLEKTYPDDMSFSDDAFRFPITQAESLAFSPGTYLIQLRVKFTSGDVIGVKAGNMQVIDSESATEL